MYIQVGTSELSANDHKDAPLAGSITLAQGQSVATTARRSLRVQLVHPPQRISSTNLVSGVTIPPLGLAYLAASLEQAGHHVAVVDAIGEGLDQVFDIDGRALRGLTFEQIIDGIDEKVDLIGMGIMFSCAWPPLRKLIHMIRDRFPNTPIVLGGEHATAMTQEVFNQSPVDYIVRGEGEETLVQLCNHLSQRANVSDVAGLVWRHEGNMQINANRARIQDIDKIPRPAWHYFNVDQYITYAQPHGSAEGRSIPMLATRGCPFQCTFCGSPGMWGTTWRARDINNVVDEMETYIERYGANDFQFEDLTAVIRKDWVLAFANEIMRRKLKINWQLPSGTRSEAIDKEAARAMFTSGCKQFTYALESGSTEMLQRIKKHIKLDKAFASAKSAMGAGIRVQAGFIYGYPDETLRQMFQTYKTILRCAIVGFHEVSVSTLQPLPNTEMFEIINAKRPIKVDDAYLDSIFGYLSIWQQKSWNPRISDFFLRLSIMATYASFFSLSFLMRPQRAFAFVRGMFGSRSGGKLARIIKGLVRNARTARVSSAPTA